MTCIVVPVKIINKIKTTACLLHLDFTLLSVEILSMSCCKNEVSKLVRAFQDYTVSKQFLEVTRQQLYSFERIYFQ